MKIIIELEINSTDKIINFLLMGKFLKFCLATNKIYWGYRKQII